MLSDVPPPVEPWMTKSLEAALRDTGCPPETAQHVSTRLRVERPGGSREWLLMLENLSPIHISEPTRLGMI